MKIKPSKACKKLNPQIPNQPNKTESRYFRDFLVGTGAKYEDKTFMISNLKYTPDWRYFVDGVEHCVEVKGGYKLPTFGRSILAFTVCRDFLYPDTVWIFATWHEARKHYGKRQAAHWEVERREGGFIITEDIENGKVVRTKKRRAWG